MNTRLLPAIALLFGFIVLAAAPAPSACSSSTASVTRLAPDYPLDPRHPRAHGPTQDWYDRDYYAVSPRKNPQGPATGAYRVVRDGSFFVEVFDLRATARAMAWPSFQAYRMIGFRPVREP